MNYKNAVDFLNSFINYEKINSFDYPEAMKLDRMRALAKELGNPQNAYESVIVAGSKGKGSICSILSSILRMDNYRVGLYTSPHLESVNERIQVNGLLINEIRFADIVSRIAKILEDSSWKKNPPTYFEFLTAVAFLYFKEMKAQIAVLEVGLGGLHDSTNIAPAKVAGIGSISLEHTDKLGKTVSKIAVQKCGIIKGREIVVSSPQTEEAEAIIMKTIEEKEASLYRVNKEIKIFERGYDENSQSFDVKTPFGDFYDLKMSLLGRHQIENAATAIALAKALGVKTRLNISEIAVKQGVIDAHWPGRLEKVLDHPTVILDGAHNAQSAQKLIDALKRHFHYNQLHLVFGVSKDKDLEGILNILLPEAATVFLAEADSPRALESKIIAQKIQDLGRQAEIHATLEETLREVLKRSAKEDLILVTGSLFLVADAKREIKKW